MKSFTSDLLESLSKSVEVSQETFLQYNVPSSSLCSAKPCNDCKGSKILLPTIQRIFQPIYLWIFSHGDSQPMIESGEIHQFQSGLFQKCGSNPRSPRLGKDSDSDDKKKDSATLNQHPPKIWKMFQKCLYWLNFYSNLNCWVPLTNSFFEQQIKRVLDHYFFGKHFDSTFRCFFCLFVAAGFFSGIHQDPFAYRGDKSDSPPKKDNFLFSTDFSISTAQRNM